MKHIKLIAVPILATLLAGGTYSSHAQDAVLIAQQAYLKASNTGVGDSFGWGAVSGDTLRELALTNEYRPSVSSGRYRRTLPV